MPACIIDIYNTKNKTHFQPTDHFLEAPHLLSNSCYNVDSVKTSTNLSMTNIENKMIMLLPLKLQGHFIFCSVSDCMNQVDNPIPSAY